MVNKSEILRLLRDQLDEGMFIVDITVSPLNAIHVYLDSFKGLTVGDCVKISRYIENELDREKEDFELDVSSPGVSLPFKVKEQYMNNIGREVEILTNEGTGLKGLLKEADPDGIMLESSSRERVEGHKKKQLIVRNYNLKYDEIKSAKVVVTFK